MNSSHIYSFIYSFYSFLIFVYVDQLIFFVLITHEIALDTRLYVIVFLFLACRKSKEYVQYISSYFCYYFIFSRSLRELTLFRNESMYQGRIFV